MTNWANKGKQALAAVTPAIPAGYGKAEKSGGEAFVAFYQFGAVKEGSKGRQLNVGDGIEGSYAGTYPGTDFDGNEIVKHKFRTAEGLVGLPVCAVINNKFNGMPEGTRYYIQYTGKGKVTTGKRKGKDVHEFQFYPALAE